MALSFEDSLKKNNVEADTSSANDASNKVEVAAFSLDDNLYEPVAFAQVDDGIATYAASEAGWTLNRDYRVFNVYSDDNISSVDVDKNVTVNPKQINITQEENSQYIPFEMPRYYDGFDLSTTAISIHYTNKNNVHSSDEPVNVRYNSDKIRFAWLVSANATSVAGNLKFEIQARGTTIDDNGESYAYVWKSRPNEKLNVMQSICNEDEIVVTDTWMQDVVKKVAQEVAFQIAEASVGEQVKEANEAAAKAKDSADKATAAVDNAVSRAEQIVNDKMDTYATKEYADNLNTSAKEYVDGLNSSMKDYVDGLDISDQLVDYVKTENLEQNYYTKTDADSKIASSLEPYATKQELTDLDITSKLDNYYTKEETYNQSEIDEKLENVTVDLSGYAKESYVDNKVDTVSASVATNANNISSLGTTVTKLQEDVGKIDTSPRLTYNVAYNDKEDPDVGENVFVLYEIENEGEDNEVKSKKTSFTIVGGSGGGGSTSSTLKIGYITTSPIVATTTDKVIIKYNFSGTDYSGDMVSDGVATWRVANRVIATNTAVAGENSFDITDYLDIGTQKVNLSIVDNDGSLVTKSWTVQVVDVRISSAFNDTFTYPVGKLSFSYTPYGAIAKTVHFVLDGKEVGAIETTSSGIPMSYELPAQTHGSHLLDVYITAEINNKTIESNHIIKDIIWYDSSSSVPVIGCAQQRFAARQYDATNIVYTVYNPSTETPTVTLAVDGKVVSTLVIDSNTQTWQYKSSDVGTHTLTITCGETVKTLTVTIEKLDIDIKPVTDGLVFDFNPSGKSNNDADRLWSDGDVSMIVSDNFDWVNGGYQIDENGDQYFCVKSGTTATINYNLFADDPKKFGREFKVIFKTTNVKNRDTVFLSCFYDGRGLNMKVEDARIYSNNNSLYSPYCEDDIIEFEFNINKYEDIPMVLTYEDGVANRPMIYSSDASFMQANPQPITIGSEDCDVYIYRMKAYSSDLTDRKILSNFIADARSADEMISRYNRNQIKNEYDAVTPEGLAEKCPDLRVIVVDAPWFTNDKSNKVEDTKVTMIYKNGDPILDNWTCTGALHSGQGTSSNEYGYAGRNIDLIMNGDDALFTLGDNITTAKTITLTRNSTPNAYLNLKVNIASSENENNAQMAMRYNEYEPFMRTARLKDSKVRDTMEFYNCAIFVRENNPDISTHREFTDCDTHFYAIGNVGDSKKTDKSRVNNAKDPKECVIEIMDYNVALAEFPTGNGKNYCPPSDWKAGNTAYDNLYAAYKYKDGSFKSFGNESYEFRYEMKGITDEQRDVNINAWRDAYKFIATSTDDEFKSNFKKYFVTDSVLYYYLFTERYTMVDNRAKNCFLHYGKAYYSQEEAAAFAQENKVDIPSKYIDDEQAAFNDGYRWDFTFGYDFDTALGISNTGKLEITYGKEDIDLYADDDEKSSYIFRAAESFFFRRIRNLFSSELQAMFVDRENVNAWSADSLINQWDNAQKQFPEELWRLDIERKYLRTYRGVSIDNSIAGTANTRFLIEMLNGRKKYQRRMFERNQELYMATKYFGNRATQDQIMMRFNNPVGAVVKQDYTLYLTPYSDMYIGVKFGNVTPVNIRAKAGVEYTIPYSIAADSADITLIYGASFIQAIGDLSKCYVGDNDFSKATRLQRLVVGSDVEGYENTYMTRITLGSNKLLEYLDVKNVTGLNSVIDLSKCNNLLELHAEGSGATGVIFANGGKLKKAYLPSIVSLTMKNLNSIEVFDVAGYDNLQTLIVENTPFINTYNIVNSASKLNTARLIGINWDESYNLEDSAILDRLLTIRGVDNDGYETQIAVLSGKFYAAVVKQNSLETYIRTWKDLDISYNTMIPQFKVTFVNYDGTILDVQYVEKGANAVDPITRTDNPIPTPTKESTVSTDFTFAGWEGSLNSIFEARTITATYSESTRRYTIKYVSKGITLQESTGLYGENIIYTGDTPTYTLEESGYKYYLFKGWDKSGYVDGDKTVNAVFDSVEYNSSLFEGRQLSGLSPVELYALTQFGVENTNIDLQDGDAYSFELGYDVDYEDIESKTIISEKTEFTGNNKIDTEIKLFDEDKDFVLAIDFEFLDGNSNGNVLAQCFQSNGSNGFKLWFNSTPKLTWGTTSTSDAKLDTGYRDMLILRHKKGDNNIFVYCSNLGSSSISIEELTRTRDTIADSTLVLGCLKADDGAYENYAIGNVYWCKIWYKDLGDEACKKLACWTHEKIDLNICGFKKYYLADNPSKRCSFTMLANNLLSRSMKYGTSNNDGGWAKSTLNEFLNTRLYESMPVQIKSILKKVTVSSSIGKGSSEISSSGCYIYIPSVVEMSIQYNDVEPYSNEASYTISSMITNDDRKRAKDGGDPEQYWLRSPNASFQNYIFTVSANGELNGFNNAPSANGVLIEISL